MAALKNMHVFLKVISIEKRSTFMKYIVQTFDDSAKAEWRLKQVLASNLGKYAELFEKDLVYHEFLPMFFKFCSDNVARVSNAVCDALCPILLQFNEDEAKQASIVRIVKNRYCKARTFKKRQLFVKMMGGQMLQNKDLFEKYFKYDFLLIANDRVDNVRIAFAKVIRHHFMKEISGKFVDDQDFNDAVAVLKQDTCEDVRVQVSDIETMTSNGDNRLVTMETFLNSIENSKMSSNWSDSDSSYSEDELKIEQEIKRHNSEDEIDHGPVLKSLRMNRQLELINEREQKKLEKEEKRKASAAQVKDLLEEATDFENKDDQIDSTAKNEKGENFDEDD
jgi:hypothetical protein